MITTHGPRPGGVGNLYLGEMFWFLEEDRFHTGNSGGQRRHARTSIYAGTGVSSRPGVLDQIDYVEARGTELLHIPPFQSYRRTSREHRFERRTGMTVEVSCDCPSQ